MLLLGRGDGTFQAPISYGVPGPLAAGDLNGDGKPDLAVRRSAGAVSILLGNGDGTFQQPAEFSAATSNYHCAGGEVTIADFNGDGRPDLAVAGSTNGGFAILLGKGDGTFAQSFAVAGCDPNMFCCGAAGYPLGVGDFNGDGKLDIITSYGFGQQRGAVLLGNGDGTFRELPGQTFSDGKLFPHGVGVYPSVIVVADLNGDGKLDAVFGYGDGGTQDGVHNDYQMVSVCLGNGDGSFQPAMAIGVGERPSSVALGDFNGDGKPDLAVANETSNNVTALINQGSGAFLTAVSAAGLTGPVAPESLASLFGALPASGKESADPQALPTTLAGITIKVRDSLGTERQAPLLYASPTQANFQIPAGTAPGDATITVTGGGTSLSGFAQVENTGPAIFNLDFDFPVAFAVRIEPDGTQTPVPLRLPAGYLRPPRPRDRPRRPPRLPQPPRHRDSQSHRAIECHVHHRRRERPGRIRRARARFRRGGSSEPAPDQGSALVGLQSSDSQRRWTPGKQGLHRDQVSEAKKLQGLHRSNGSFSSTWNPGLENRSFFAGAALLRRMAGLEFGA